MNQQEQVEALKALFDKGLAAYKKAQFKQASELFSTCAEGLKQLIKAGATELRPELARTRMNLGNCLNNLGELNEARAMYEASLNLYQDLVDKDKRLELRPDLARTRMNLGICLNYLGDLNEARAMYEAS